MSRSDRAKIEELELRLADAEAEVAALRKVIQAAAEEAGLTTTPKEGLVALASAPPAEKPLAFTPEETARIHEILSAPDAEPPPALIALFAQVRTLQRHADRRGRRALRLVRGVGSARPRDGAAGREAAMAGDKMAPRDGLQAENVIVDLMHAAARYDKYGDAASLEQMERARKLIRAGYDGLEERLGASEAESTRLRAALDEAQTHITGLENAQLELTRIFQAQSARMGAERDAALARAEALEFRAREEARRAEAAERERDLAVAHDRQPYPTAEAYEKVCALLRASRERCGALERALRDWEAGMLWGDDPRKGMVGAWWKGSTDTAAIHARVLALLAPSPAAPGGDLVPIAAVECASVFLGALLARLHASVLTLTKDEIAGATMCAVENRGDGSVRLYLSDTTLRQHLAETRAPEPEAKGGTTP